MKKGEIIKNLSIVDIASNGKALGRHEGQVVFVDMLVPGDVADIQIYKKRSKYAEGRSVALIQPSSKRIEPRCIHFGVCGGCKWQHMDYKEQLIHKQKHVAENLRKLSGISLPEIQDIIPSENQFYYRNKMEYTFSNSRWLTEEEIKSEGDFSNRSALGFHVPGRFDKIVDIRECHLQDSISDEIRNFVKSYSIENELSFFDLREQKGLLRNLIIRNTVKGEVMLVLAVTAFNEKVISLLENLKIKFPSITSLNYVVNDKRNDTIFDLDVICFSGKDHITEEMKDLKYRIGPKSFYQTNGLQAEKLYELAKKFADIKKSDLVYDLYTGTGTIANYLASDAKKVIGIEYVEDAVEDARKNAILNNIDNTEFFAGDMQKLLTPEFFSKHGAPNVIVTDPPRAGMHADVVVNIRNSGAERIVYVSCNPASQARDLEILDEAYEVKILQPVDMFPHTAHVENIAVLQKRKS